MQQIQTLPANVRAIIFDLDGVLWRGRNSTCDLPTLFHKLSELSIKYMLATNSGVETIASIKERMLEFGVKVRDNEILNSPFALGHLLRERYPNGGPVFIMGEQGLVNTMQGFGFYHDEKNAMAVVAGLNRNFTYDHLKKTSLLIRSGLPFYFTNHDPTFPSTEGQVPGAGSVLAALEVASGVKAILAGKPQPFLFKYAMEILGTVPNETLVIGDRLDTDIAGGQNAGCLTAIVLTGVSTLEQINAWKPAPDLILENVISLFDDV